MSYGLINDTCFSNAHGNSIKVQIGLAREWGAEVMKQFLLIDDDPVEYMYVNYLVKDWYGEGCNVGHVTNLEKAKDYLAKNRVDVILLDDRLEGGLTAIDTIPQLQRMAFNVPVIVVSKNANSQHLKTLAKLNANAVIDKFELRQALSDGVLD